MKLSMLMPVYNESATLRQIVSLVRQPDLDLEIVAVDDGSVDGSLEILRDLEGQGLIDRVLVHASNRGKGAAIRTGLQAVTGEAADVHQVMVAVEEAGIALDLMLEIRNRVLEGYQELIRMQV